MERVSGFSFWFGVEFLVLVFGFWFGVEFLVLVFGFLGEFLVFFRVFGGVLGV